MMAELKLFNLCLLLICVSISALCSSPSSDDDWEKWKAKYNKEYTSLEEENIRKAIWWSNYVLVKSHNKKVNVTFAMGLNMFADQLPRKRMPMANRLIQYSFQSMPQGASPPANFDWRDKGDVTEVKNQGQLGYAEAFSAAECVESYHAIHDGHLQDLSAQEVADCCSISGLPVVNDVFGCIHKHGGLCSATSYKGKGKCANNTCTAVAQGVSKTVFIKKGDEDGMVTATLLVPLMVYVDASHSSFQLYTSGIYQDPDCSKTELDHSLQIVGYGVDSQGTKYWICRNSWGASWGMKGYINILRGQNMCGIATMAKYPA